MASVFSMILVFVILLVKIDISLHYIIVAECLITRQQILHCILESVYMFVLCFRNAISSCACAEDVLLPKLAVGISFSFTALTIRAQWSLHINIVTIASTCDPL